MYHVMGRGNERKVIFKDDTDRELFLKVWEEGLEKYEGICHAWCLINMGKRARLHWEENMGMRVEAELQG